MSYYVTNENSVLNINNAHLKVSGNVMTDVMKLGAIEFAPPASNVAGTVNFTNVTTGVTTSSNLSVGGTLSLGTVEVVATTHTLANTTANGNVTPHTVQFSNATTGFVTTANVEVGGELTVTGNVAVDTDTLFVDSVNDRVGIGTTSPTNTLHIRNAIPAVLLDDTGDDTKVRLTGGTGGDLYIDANYGGSGSTGDIILREATSEKMRVTGAGLVGIGTNAPSHALNVKATSGDAEVHIQAQGNDGGDAILYFNGSSTNQRKCAIISSNVAPNSYCKQDLHFCMETTNDLSDVDITDSKMVLTNAGNVGIGTTNPSSKLTINQEPEHDDVFDFSDIPLQVNYNSVVTSSSTLNDPKTVMLLTREGTISESYAAGAGFRLSRWENNGVNSRSRLDIDLKDGSFDLTNVMTLKSDSKVGIGKTAPSTALDVNGIIKQTGANWALTNTGVTSEQDRGAAPSDYAYLNRTLSTPTNVTLTHENQSGYNTRSRITIGTTGKYAMYVNGFRQTGTSGTKELFIYKNGTYTYVRAYSGPEGTSNYATAGGAYTIMDLNANDYVEVYIGQGTYHGNDSIYFAGHLIA